ncbi:MAG TPA: RNA polymerase sigma factor [Thermoanaerobaculia bacterium]|nr:RNA polymerase sigma factor [Thermoanaerobaculia bacterium]
MTDAIEQDRGFWRAAYQSHAPAVLAFLQHRLGRREDAEDLLQETFVRAIRSGSFDGDNLRAYLLRTAHNLWVNRRRRPRLVVPAGSPGGENDAPFADVPAEAASPEQEASWSAFREELQRVLAGLSEPHRRAFELGALEQHSYDEIAQITGWSLPQVKVNLYRARKRVIEELREHFPQAIRGRRPGADHERL